jgi:hypothetical protein
MEYFLVLLLECCIILQQSNYFSNISNTFKKNFVFERYQALNCLLFPIQIFKSRFNTQCTAFRLFYTKKS